MNYHTPVLLKESADLLVSGKEGFYVDATAGGGGHSVEILKRIVPSGKLVAFDRDEESHEQLAIKLRQEGLEDYCISVHDNFSSLKEHLALMNIKKISGILFDLGVSSRQIDEPFRGFSYMKDGPLDMRMDQRSAVTAEQVLNSASGKDLEAILRNYGEERMAKRIINSIVSSRPLSSTSELCGAVRRAVPKPMSMAACVRVFQALRIHVNKELESLETALADAVKLLEKGSRIVVISYHSLEDRIVKQFFRTQSLDCICDNRAPKCTCSHKKALKILTKKPVCASRREVLENPRARSAKLRAAERM
ncbi:MAG: 16S rRNA (cytosine(1402)-N(4))-methyltransferase RsmH [Candidatus Margulisiibacteriota bacterium]